MFYTSIHYKEPLFRPPSEAYSLIFQVTYGCSWNKCAFCEMYTSKKFQIRDEAELMAEIDSVKGIETVRKVFLADGNAFVLSYSRLMKILNRLNQNLPKLMRVSAYASARDILGKTPAELGSLKEAGLKLLYIGIESGDDQLLKIIHKGETYDTTKEAIIKAQLAGIKTSVMILNGLGGKKYAEQHAIQSAKLINEIQPDYLSTLVLSFPYGEQHYRNKFDGEFIQLNPIELIQELGIFIQNLELKNTIYRSDHASNYLVLKGVLNKDKNLLMARIARVLNNPDQESLREEWMRGL